MRVSPGARKQLVNLLKIVVSVGFLALLLSRAELGEAFQRLRTMRLPFWLGAMALYIAGEFVRGYRWGVLLWSLGSRVSYRRLTSLYFVGSFYNLVLPTGFGGDAVKVLELSQDAGTTAAISSVLVERFSGFLVLFLLAALALAGSYRLIPPLLAVAVLVMALSGVLLVALLVQRTWIERGGRRLRIDRLFARIAILRNLYHSLGLYPRGALARATGAALVFNLMQILANILLARAVGVDVPAAYFFLFVPLIAFTNTLPSLGGLGLREGAYVFLFTQVGVDHPHALALALARDMTIFGLGTIGALVYVAQSALAGRRQRDAMLRTGEPAPPEDHSED